MRFFRQILLLCLACLACFALSAQTIPSVGDAAADAFLTRVSQNRFQLHSASLAYSGNTLYISASGYFFCDTLIETPDEEGEMTVMVAQRPLRKEEPTVLEDIHFEFNSYLLTEDSYDQLRRLAELMRQNPTIRVEISAHTDNVGSDAFNMTLSERRGRSVVEYLVEEEGIDPSRMNAKGYGKTRPLVDNDTEENRAVNRRVEFTVLEL